MKKPVVLKRRKISKQILKLNQKLRGADTIGLNCQCGEFVDNLPADTISITCPYCVQKMIEPPPVKIKPTVKYARGWHLMNHYKAPDGKVFKRGKEIS